MIGKKTIFFIVALFMLSGCAYLQQNNKDTLPVDEDNQQTIPFLLPVTFSGTTTGPGCDYVQIDLNLRPDDLYQLRSTCYVDEKIVKQKSQMRRWAYEASENIIILGEKKDNLKTYDIVSTDTLHFFGEEGQETGAIQGYDLVRKESYDPFTDIVKISGMYVSNGDMHGIKECSSGVVFPVDTGDAFNDMEKAYKNTPHETNEPLLVSIQGSLIPTPGGEELRDKDIMIVKSFNRLYPDQVCMGAKRENILFDKLLTAIEINGEQVLVSEGQRVPYLMLSSEGNKVRGFCGCNRLSGTFFLKGNVLLFNKVMTTRMACMYNLSLENQFLDALDKTETYLIEDENLTLLDRNDNVVMRLVREGGVRTSVQK